MKSLRKRLTREFPAKVYPNPADPKVVRKIDAGVVELKNLYLGNYFPWIGMGAGAGEYTGSYYTTNDPNTPSLKVGSFPIFTHDALEGIVAFRSSSIRAAGRRFFLETPWQKRVALLEMISRVVKERFWLLCAAKMYETGQSIAEAIGETDEEVDFPLANAMYLEEHHRDLLIASPESSGDLNGKRYLPHGVLLDVEPFNFPGAIPMDMATKALAMGNAVILKPSPKASLCGYLVWETIKFAFERMKIDWCGVVNYAPGGKEVVDAFLSHPEIAGMSFTGSSAVLNDIKRNHGDLLRYGWAGRAKLVTGSAETSGVNVFIVCEDADPVYAAHEYVKSFTGRSGQKCSSARIGLVHKGVYKRFVAAMVERLEQIRYGDVKKGADLGAMITAADRDNLVAQIEKLYSAGMVRTLYKHPIISGPGYDFPPTVLQFYTDDRGYITAEVERLMNTELFGPASTIVRFSSVDTVEAMCKLTRFALTGSIFTNDLEVLRRVLNFIPAGNAYWNRGCTGAKVETECFGGLRSASSPNGIKGKGALLLFGSQQTLSGFCPRRATGAYRREAEKMFRGIDFGLSKRRGR